MIDLENEIFDKLYEKVTEKYPNVTLSSIYQRVPSSFPYVSVLQINNSTYQRTISTSGENHAMISLEINIYSNKTEGRKSECKAIASLIDEILIEWNFTRNMLQPIPNLEDATIYRIIGRYDAVISKDTIYRR